MKKLLFFLLYLITITVGAYLGIRIFDSNLAIYLTGVFVGDFSLLFINLMRDYTILEICRTGRVSLERGSTTIRQTINL